MSKGTCAECSHRGASQDAEPCKGCCKLAGESGISYALWAPRVAPPPTTWAEGSGSTWQDLDGDPRIVAGAEVLVGCATGNKPIRLLGTRDTVNKVRAHPISTGHKMVSLSGPESGRLWWRARDLVLLRLASGELTEEGRALAELDSFAPGACIKYHWLSEWLERAGILRPEGGTGHPHWTIDPRRLAMALGGEEASAEVRDGAIVAKREVRAGDVVSIACHYTGLSPERVAAEFRRAEAATKDYTRVCGNCIHYNAPAEALPCLGCYGSADKPRFVGAVTPATSERRAAPVMCASCGVQPLCTAEHCADCAQVYDDAHLDAVEPGPPPDLSGERHREALRAWLARPMGTR